MLDAILSRLQILVIDIKESDLHDKIYGFSFAILFAGILTGSINPSLYATSRLAMALSLCGFAAGFTVWCFPVVSKIWRHAVGKVLILVVHLFVLLLATALARIIVTSAIGLPPQDLDLTVAFITFASYLPVWSFLVSIIAAIVTITQFVTGFISMVLNRPLLKVMKVFARGFGALGLITIFATLNQFAILNEKALHSIIKRVAYWSDFHNAYRYPGIAESERIRLHENGVISVAHEENGEIQVLIRKFE